MSSPSRTCSGVDTGPVARRRRAPPAARNRRRSLDRRRASRDGLPEHGRTRDALPAARAAGPGQIVGSKLEEPMRSHHDIEKETGNTKALKPPPPPPTITHPPSSTTSSPSSSRPLPPLPHPSSPRLPSSRPAPRHLPPTPLAPPPPTSHTHLPTLLPPPLSPLTPPPLSTHPPLPPPSSSSAPAPFPVPPSTPPRQHSQPSVSRAVPQEGAQTLPSCGEACCDCRARCRYLRLRARPGTATSIRLARRRGDNLTPAAPPPSPRCPRLSGRLPDLPSLFVSPHRSASLRCALSPRSLAATL